MAFPSQPQTFALENCRSLLDKLEREIKRLRETDGPERSDHAFNAAVTAWQLCDWVFADMTPAQRAKWEFRCDRDMQAHARQHCRALYLCRQVATASKHMTVTTFPDLKVKVITTANVIPPPNADPPSTQRPPLYVAPGWFLYIDDDGDVRTAEDVFADAYDFWTQFIYVQNKIPED